MAGRAQAIPRGWFDGLQFREADYQAVCPHCESGLEIRMLHREVHAALEPGTVNVCLDCGGVSIFKRDGATMTLRVALPAELEEAMQFAGLRLAHEEIDAAAQRNP